MENATAAQVHRSCSFELGKQGLYSTFRYPGGEMQVRLSAEGMRLIDGCSQATIQARITEPNELVELALLADAVHPYVESLKLILPYLPYARADRRFVPGDCFGLNVFGKLIAAAGADVILTLDAHSNESETCIPILVSVSPDSLIQRAILEFCLMQGCDKVNVLFPDRGALTRYSSAIDQYLGNNHHAVETKLFHASKQRDAATGAFLGFDIPELPERPTIIIDDICDGGGTFIGIGERVHAIQPNARLGLYVTHGLFSKGLRPLLKHFTHVWSTNSFCETHDDPRRDLTTFDCLPLLYKAALTR